MSFFALKNEGFISPTETVSLSEMGEAISYVPCHQDILIRITDFLVMQRMLRGTLLCYALSVNSFDSEA